MFFITDHNLSKIIHNILIEDGEFQKTRYDNLIENRIHDNNYYGPGESSKMSIYLINGQYIFNEGTKELKTLNNDTNIRLTTMRSRCLSFIIEHAADDVIEKSAISYALWGARSTFTSDASLTQTLYLIRRDLKTLGLDEVFITVPKSGIRINSSITIDVIHEKPPKTKLSYKPLFLTLPLLLLLIGIGVYLALTI